MEKMHLILITALLDIAGDLAIWSGQEPSETIALALFKSSLQVKTIGLDEVNRKLRILEPQLADALEVAIRTLIAVVDDEDENKK
jgi:hypothetical protein